MPMYIDSKIACLERKYSSGCESAMRISVLFVLICRSVERGEERVEAVLIGNLLITAPDSVRVVVVVVVVNGVAVDDDR